MPSRLATPVLAVDAGKMHKVDTRNVENLFGMWMVFSKCAESIEEGKRLENLSWRLWNRETFCCEPQPQLATTPAIDVPLTRPRSRDIPELSASVDSAVSEEEEEVPSHSETRSIPINQSPKDEDSALSRSRGKEKHITSLGLESLVFNIKEKKELEPLSPTLASSLSPLIDITPRPSSPSPRTEPRPQREQKPHSQQSTDSCLSAATLISNRSDRSSPPIAGSDTSASSGGLPKSSSVVHGFSPSRVSSSFRSNSRLALEVAQPARSILHTRPEPAKKATGMFTLGGSSGEDESSFEDRMSRQQQRQQPNKSSLTNGMGKTLHSRKQTSFREEVEARPIRTIKESKEDDEDAIESDDDDDVSESAIEDDDDSSEWEDSVSESGRSSVEEKAMFKRVDSRANLVSRRSLLTTMMTESERKNALLNAASQSQPILRRSRTSSPTGPSVAASPEDEDEEATLTMRGPNVSKARPIIVTTSNTHPPAHSPRTTRRNMLATELTESLRRHLLWERQQKSTTANAVFKRRHTAAEGLSKLQDYPGTTKNEAQVETSKNNSWNHYFDYGPWEYHTKGW